MGNQLLDKIIKAPLDSATATGCPSTCTNTGYRVSVTENQNFDDSVRFYVYYKNNDYSFSEETDMYDFNAIVAGVGGSLGLFLAFSCRGFLVGVLDRLAKHWAARKQDKVAEMQCSQQC